MQFIGLGKSEDAAVISTRYLMYILVYVVVWRIGNFNLAFASRLRIFSLAREYLPEVVRSHVIQA